MVEAMVHPEMKIVDSSVVGTKCENTTSDFGPGPVKIIE